MPPENQWLVQMYFLLKSSLFRGTNSFVRRGATPRIPVSSCNCLFRTPENTEVTPAQVKLLVYPTDLQSIFSFFSHISDCEILHQEYWREIWSQHVLFWIKMAYWTQEITFCIYSTFSSYVSSLLTVNLIFVHLVTVFVEFSTHQKGQVWGEDASSLTGRIENKNTAVWQP